MQIEKKRMQAQLNQTGGFDFSKVANTSGNRHGETTGSFKRPTHGSPDELNIMDASYNTYNPFTSSAIP